MGDLDQGGWERRWAAALEQHGDAVSRMPPNATFLEEVDGLTPGRALDAGCGHGAESIWLAARGWRVTAVDFSVTALDFARGAAEAVGAEVAGRVDWVQGDLGAWAPEPAAYDLVVCVHVHVAGSVEEMVARLGSGVAPGGTLLLVGHQPLDPETGEPTPAAGQVQVSVADALAALDDGWQVVVAEDRRHQKAGWGVDAVVRAVRG